MNMNELEGVDPGVIRKDYETGMFSVIDVVKGITGKHLVTLVMMFERLSRLT